ncbi:MAG: flippase-like domain-containing protein [Planctomycetes bacterium]|nr:flippase-like domain-containing protein [Planctomycetota bacterium]
MTRKHWLTLLKLALAAGLIYYVLSKVDFHDHVDANGQTQQGLLSLVRGMDLPMFLLGASCYFVAASFSSIRWWWLLRVNGLVVTLAQTFRLTWIGIFFNNVIPGATGGDVVKAVYVARLTGRKLRPVLSVLVDRVLGLVALALLAAIMTLFLLDEPIFRWVAAVLWGGLAGLAVILTVFSSKRIRRRIGFDRLLQKLPASAKWMQFDDALTHYHGHLGGIFVWLVLSMANHFIAVVGVYLIGEALHGVLPFSRYVVLVPVIQIMTALPLAPAGFGVGEWGFSFFWPRCGAAFVSGIADPAAFLRTQGVTLSLVYRLHMMLWSLLGGVFVLVQPGRPTEADAAALLDAAEAQSIEGHSHHDA